MNKMLILGFLAFLFCPLAVGLLCKVCESGNAKECYSKVEFCKTNYGQCYTYIAYLDSEPYFMRYNCLDSEFERWYCNKTAKNGHYVHIESCCATEKCNGEIPPLPRTWD